jgi:hypothetical protein
MKSIYLLLALILTVQQLPAQTSDDIHGFRGKNNNASYAPLLLFTNGPGRIYPFQSGRMLQVGREYYMIAIPDRGYVFTNWNEVNVFTITSAEIDFNTSPPTTNFITSTVLSPVPAYTRNPLLRFTMEPEQVLYNINGNSLTESIGWQANFVPLTRDVSHRRDPE